MPGIAGILTDKDHEQSAADVRLMIAAMHHESFYSDGVYSNEVMGVHIGWLCHRDSSIDCMPIWNEAKDICLFFYGEDYPDSQTMDRLRAGRHDFSGGNSSYLVHLYEDDGDEFFRNLNGFFNGVIVDLRKWEVVLFNDRFGIQRMYYREGDQKVMFSSEAKSLLQTRTMPCEIDENALGQLMSMGCVLDNRPLFKGISILPGGTLWRFAKGKSRNRERYFDRGAWENQEKMTPDAFYACLRKTLVEILPGYLRSANPVGMSLTGGLDTRIIMAHANSEPFSLPCYTFGSMYRDSFDVKVARKVAASCRQNHSTIRVGNEFLSNFESYAQKAVYISDGYLDAASGAVELYINQQAREIAPVRLTGCFGSEVLRNIPGFRYRIPNTNLFDDGLLAHARRAQEVYREGVKGHPLSMRLFKEAPFFNYNRMSVEQSQVIKRTPFMDNRFVALAYQAPPWTVTTDRVSVQLVKDANRRLSEIVTNRGKGGMRSRPFAAFVQRGYEALARAEIGYDYGMPQWLSRLDLWLRFAKPETLFAGWNSFYHFRTWFRDQLSESVKAILLDRRSMERPYLNRTFLEKMVALHMRGEGNYTNEINSVLTLELIHRSMMGS